MHRNDSFVEYFGGFILAYFLHFHVYTDEDLDLDL